MIATDNIKKLEKQCNNKFIADDHGDLPSFLYNQRELESHLQYVQFSYQHGPKLGELIELQVLESLFCNINII